MLSKDEVLAAIKYKQFCVNNKNEFDSLKKKDDKAFLQYRKNVCAELGYQDMVEFMNKLIEGEINIGETGIFAYYDMDEEKFWLGAHIMPKSRTVQFKDSIKNCVYFKKGDLELEFTLHFEDLYPGMPWTHNLHAFNRGADKAFKKEVREFLHSVFGLGFIVWDNKLFPGSECFTWVFKNSSQWKKNIDKIKTSGEAQILEFVEGNR